MRELLQIHQRLLSAYGHSRGWPGGEWPLSGRFRPQRFEVVAGAVLTQNTSWSNVEKALGRLIDRGLVEASLIARSPLHRLERAILPAGFYRQKARYLKEVACFIARYPGDFYREVDREQLLSIRGIGPETADSILLYACQRPEFVADAYTRRIFSRYGWLDGQVSYEQMKEFFQSRLSADIPLYKTFHALIVEHAKQTCRKKPLCQVCVLRNRCAFALTQ